MAVLGKRKASAAVVPEDDINEIFRRHFESQFLPLEPSEDKSAAQEDSKDEEDEEDEDEDDEWGGLSGDDDEEEEQAETPIIEVVDHSSTQIKPTTTMSKRELKAFMSSRPPDQHTLNKSTTADTDPSSSSSSSSKKQLPEDAPSLLAQDLELRRLLAESHLLAPAHHTRNLAVNASSATPEPKSFAAGRVRQKATDMRIQALGSKASIHRQESMPMSIRKGIVAAASSRETKRRREAKESGVILERETGGKKKQKRDRGRDWMGDRPSVGRMRGAELRVSERDVKSIEGTRDTFGRRNKKSSARF